MMSKRKHRGYWNYDTCKELASTCNSRSEMKYKNQQAYDVSRKNKWLEEFFGTKTQKMPVYWNNYDICQTEAMKYSCSSEFEKGNSSAYHSARRNKWLKIFFPNKKKPGLPSKYTYEKCKELALKCKSRTDFAKRYHQAWTISKDNLWIDDFTWLRNIHIFTDKIDTVYSYEFNELNAVYIGRTIDIISRDKYHRGFKKYVGSNKDSVYRFAKENNCDIPQVKILKNNITIEEGCELEDYYKNKYKKEGWKVLNKAQTGKGSSSVGNTGIYRHTIEEFLEVAKKYTTRTQFARGDDTWYNYGRHKGWLDKCTWFIPSSILYSKSNKTHTAKPIAQIDPYNGEIIKVFPSITEAERELKLSHIDRKLKKDNSRLIDGFRWEFVNK